MTADDVTKNVPRDVLDAEILVEMCRYASGSDQPEAMIATLVGSIVLVADRAIDTDSTLAVAIDGLEQARKIKARRVGAAS